MRSLSQHIHLNTSMNAIAGRILRYFFSGTIFIVPLLATAYFIYISFTWLDQQLNLPYPGLGFVIIFSVITLIGYLSSIYIFRTLGHWFDTGMNRIPFVKIIYSTVKDLLGAVVGDKRKFNKPVLVTINQENHLHQIGFITQDDLSRLGLQDMVVVYIPHSYALSGYHYFVKKENIRPLNISGPAAMKFIVSGGVSGL
ncbi:MAG TPA: DUF502 domain-containing protein [Chryseosolibacter sp.]|nr:DUF502 domain-containing protein [Chryseosolibacter sp.]